MKKIKGFFDDGVRTLREKYTIPPFSVFDSKAAYWSRRKKKWLSLGIKSELGRDARAFNNKTFLTDASPDLGKLPETSVFDPVICEIAYRWFCPAGGVILDPFAGGSVRGIVAGVLGRNYVGIDLREDQIVANQVQVDATAMEGSVRYVRGDACMIPRLLPRDFTADLVFTCPPYYDLERYSDDPNDLSNKNSYEDFVESLSTALRRSLAKLRENRFAVVVVGDIRDTKGYYRGLVLDTVAALESAGAFLYNDIVYLSPVGSAMLRAERQFIGSRKLVKCHQNILVAFKGDLKTVRENFTADV